MEDKFSIRMGRWQEIKYYRRRGEGEEVFPYVRYRNQRLYLENFIRGDFIEESKAAGMKIHGAYATSYFDSFFIHLSDDGDRARVGYAHW